MHGRRRIGLVGGAVLGLGGLVVGAAWAFQRSLVFVPDADPVQTPPGMDDVVLTTSDGLELDAWLIGPSADVDRETAVLYLPGNGGNRAGRVDVGRGIAARGFTVLLLDYRGYGGNPGSPSEEGLARDAVAALAVLRDEGFGLDETLYLGESIGTGVAARLQDAHPPAGVLLRSPFTDFVAVASHHYPFLPVSALLRDRFPVQDHVSTSRVPTTVVHGSADHVVPSQQSASVAGQAGNLVEEVVLDGVGHNDPEMFGAPVIDALVRLAERVDR